MSFRHVILHNFWLKLVSLGLGSLIWLGVHYQIQSDYPINQPHASRTVFRQTITIPISIITKPGDGRAFRISPREASATVLGEEAVLRKISPKDLMIYIDLTEFHSRQPTSETLATHAPVDVLVSDISPASVTVEQISP